MAVQTVTLRLLEPLNNKTTYILRPKYNYTPKSIIIFIRPDLSSRQALITLPMMFFYWSDGDCRRAALHLIIILQSASGSTAPEKNIKDEALLLPPALITQNARRLTVEVMLRHLRQREGCSNSFLASSSTAPCAKGFALRQDDSEDHMTFESRTRTSKLQAPF